MLREELAKLRKLIKGVERGEGSFESIYKKLDRIQNILQQDSDNSEDQVEAPSRYIKPIQGMLDNYQQSLDKLKQQNRKLMAAIPSAARQNERHENSQQTKQAIIRKPAITTHNSNVNDYHSVRNANSGQRSASSTQPKTIKQLDAEIFHLTNQIRNTLR